MKYGIRYFLILALGLFIGAGVSLQYPALAERNENLKPLPLQELRSFTEIFGKIKTDYVEDVADDKLIEDAIHGMLGGLDPHSAYLDPESFREIRIGTEGKFGGLGIEVTMENGFVKVVAPIDDTPAAAAGLRTGDVIIRIDETPVKGLSLNDAVKKMRGEPGTDVKLSIVREGESAPFGVSITRAIIKITSVKSRLLENNYGYVRITQFQANSADALRKSLRGLNEENKGPLKGLVLDLRNNPGGVLNAAVGVSDVFLTDGKIVYTKGRVEDSELNFSATPADLLEGAPIVVLVNGGSASASEIVAGALQDQKRAIIMGTKTFGKGSVQTILPMNNGAALKITTARYYTPGGRSIQATGIVPDVIVEDLQVAKGAGKAQRIREADLAGHLDSDNDNDNGETAEKATTSAAVDYQLQEALNLLKGVNIVRDREAA